MQGCGVGVKGVGGESTFKLNAASECVWQFVSIFSVRLKAEMFLTDARAEGSQGCFNFCVFVFLFLRKLFLFFFFCLKNGLVLPWLSSEKLDFLLSPIQPSG